MSYNIYECQLCGFIYDEGKGLPSEGIAAGTRWEDIPDDWQCPDCGVEKSDFDMIGISKVAAAVKQSINHDASPTHSPNANNQTEQNNQQATATTSNIKPVVIIGTGLAGYNVAREFRKHDTQTPLVMLSADDGHYYSKPMLSTAYAKGQQAEQLVISTVEQMQTQLQATIHPLTRVQAIDTQAHTVSAGEHCIEYSQLVLATGAKCIEAPLSGDGLERVYNINNLQDYAQFRQTMHSKKKVLIIGAGLIGCEYANDLIQSDFEVEVVEAMPTVLASLLPEPASKYVQTTLEQAGVRYHLETVAKTVDKQGDGVRVTLANNDIIEADVVLSAIGVRADLELAKMAGLETERGIITDRSLRTSAKDVFALGDCAEVDGHLLYFIAPLMDSARVLGQVLSGQQTQVEYGAMPIIIKTTLCPVVCIPAPKQAQGHWQMDDSADGVVAKFINNEQQCLGFALTANATQNKDQLLKQTQALMTP